MLIALSAISQKSADSCLCIPVSQLKAAIVKIEQGKIMESELTFTRLKVDLLQQRIAIKDSSIRKFQKQDSLYQKIIWGYEGSIDNWKQILSNTENAYRIEKKIVRRQKIVKWLSLAAGIGAGYLFFK